MVAEEGLTVQRLARRTRKKQSQPPRPHNPRDGAPNVVHSITSGPPVRKGLKTKGMNRKDV
jgi:hypothetical protein